MPGREPYEPVGSQELNEAPLMNMHPKYSRRTFLKTLGTTAIAAPFIARGLMAQSPSSTLRHASFGAAGMALADLTQIGNCPGVELVAICDVDLARTAKALKLFPRAKVYQDWRELLDKEGKNLDSANVSTPDHMHASIGLSAMQMGITSTARSRSPTTSTKCAA